MEVGMNHMMDILGCSTSVGAESVAEPHDVMVSDRIHSIAGLLRIVLKNHKIISMREVVSGSSIEA